MLPNNLVPMKNTGIRCRWFHSPFKIPPATHLICLPRLVRYHHVYYYYYYYYYFTHTHTHTQTDGVKNSGPLYYYGKVILYKTTNLRMYTIYIYIYIYIRKFSVFEIFARKQEIPKNEIKRFFFCLESFECAYTHMAGWCYLVLARL